MPAKHTDSQGGWFTRWRKHRRAMRQQTVERRYYHQERARATGIASGAEDFTTARAYARAYPSDAAGPWSGMLHDVGAKNAGDKS